MTPIHTVLDQIRWDPRLDEARFEVVWRDRSGLDVREAVSAFRARGEVPLHRIQQVWCDGEMVWDRQTRLDVVQKVAARASERGPIRSAGFWNVEEPEPERVSPVVEAVLALGVDVLGLCEVHEDLLSALRLRLPSDKTLLSAGPIAALLPADRAWQAVSLPLPGREGLLASSPELTVAVAHLTSDARGDRALRREEQLAALAAALPRQGPLLVLLDANTERELSELDALGLLDMGSPPTFDPGANARVRSRTPEPRRLDRVLVRGLQGAPGVVVRHDPPLSDHWALAVALGERAQTEALGRSASTALVLLPPEPLVQALDAIRQGKDQAFGRWPAHITVRHPFVAPERVEEAVVQLAHALVQAEPLQVALTSTGLFSHAGERWTLWAAPTPAPPLLALRAQVDEALPHLREGRPYTPHLTLATGEGPLPQLDPVPREPFQVDRLVVLVREADRFEPVDHVPLGGGVPLGEALQETGLWDQGTAWQAVVEQLRARLPGELLVVGGSAWGTRLVGSDLDLVWRPPDLPDPLAFLVEQLAELSPRRIDALHAPRVKLHIGAMEVDIQLEQEEVLRDVARAQAASEDQRLAIVALKAWAHRRQLPIPASVGWLDLVLVTPGSPEQVLSTLWTRLADPQDLLVLAGSAFRGARPAEVSALRHEARQAAALVGAWRAVFRNKYVGGPDSNRHPPA
jgi:poly(A) polymerase